MCWLSGYPCFSLLVPRARRIANSRCACLSVPAATHRMPRVSNEAIAREVPEAFVGAGTLRSSNDAAAAAREGARFAVSPGYTPALGSACRDAGLPLLPGVATASEIMAAQADGFDALKFFPALQSGGSAMLKAWQGPFGDVLFCPTGGIQPGNAAEFLALANVAYVGGSWLVSGDALAQGDWERITALPRAASQLARG
ncbi:bifunctional 4-hydroxy-2-oxoglutarate aldolase/2-dehydro-3-deoxy-phosphogluconate aldolase [Comamonas antarctica]|uniref:bifunctional 4-hydroxy-2-oxoglutarate aldolase/2-dehydro-3-deoxy-phosphogluconate aldolase n=1 Tax=Comamonas antarctica TaxID=2743470 RepID=UPI0036F31CAE